MSDESKHFNGHTCFGDAVHIYAAEVKKDPNAYNELTAELFERYGKCTKPETIAVEKRLINDAMTKQGIDIEELER